MGSGEGTAGCGRRRRRLRGLRVPGGRASVCSCDLLRDTAPRTRSPSHGTCRPRGAKPSRAFVHPARGQGSQIQPRRAGRLAGERAHVQGRMNGSASLTTFAALGAFGVCVRQGGGAPPLTEPDVRIMARAVGHLPHRMNCHTKRTARPGTPFASRGRMQLPSLRTFVLPLIAFATACGSTDPQDLDRGPGSGSSSGTAPAPSGSSTTPAPRTSTSPGPANPKPGASSTPTPSPSATPSTSPGAALCSPGGACNGLRSCHDDTYVVPGNGTCVLDCECRANTGTLECVLYNCN